jgi:ABC-type phosphate/phosphonate transport system substrate-binding protein
MSYRKQPWSWLFAVLVVLSGTAHADLVLSTQPRGAAEKFAPPFDQVARYLSKKIGVKVVYHYSGDWISYSQNLRQDKFDIVFDEPHFVAWRIANRKHTLVAAAVPEASEKHVVIVKRDNASFWHVGQLAGHTVCGMAPPNFATLSLMAQYSNPVRIPLIVPVQNYEDAYRGLLAGKCVAAVLSDISFEQLDKNAGKAKAIYVGYRLMPGDAFTVGSRVSDEMRGKILQALLVPEAADEIPLFIDRYAYGKLLDLPVEEQYEGLDALLHNVYGFDR